MSDTLDTLLTVLADLDEAVLCGVYSITREDADRGAPLDAALYAWRDAGCPRVVGEVVPVDGCYRCAHFRPSGGVAGSWACAALGDVDGIGEWIDLHNRTTNGRRPDGSAPLTVPTATGCPGYAVRK